MKNAYIYWGGLGAFKLLEAHRKTPMLNLISKGVAAGGGGLSDKLHHC